jgi:hypothetical protein
MGVGGRRGPAPVDRGGPVSREQAMHPEQDGILLIVLFSAHRLF